MTARVRNDRITLAGVRLEPRIGVTPGERRLPQTCHADITVWGDFEAAGISDSLDKALDYTKILARVLEIAHAGEYNLLEALAYKLARELARSLPARSVNVRIRKFPVALLAKLDFIEVEVEQP